jgi:8-oxo-dGTP pyrophosphatase MutT (NUDIX family)
MTEPHTTYSAGGVVYSPRGRVAVVSQRGDSWSLPKGHLEPGETARQAAQREIYEEAGVEALTFIQKLGSYTRFRIGKHGRGEDRSERKHITLFLFATDEETQTPRDATHPALRWVPPEEVPPLLTHPRDRAFFEEVLPQIYPSLGSDHEKPS